MNRAVPLTAALLVLAGCGTPADSRTQSPPPASATAWMTGNVIRVDGGEKIAG